MKKVLSYILISLILTANLLAPISVGFDSKNNIRVQKNEARAENTIKVQTTTWTNSDTIRVNVAVLWGSNNFTTKEEVEVELFSLDGTSIEIQKVPMTDSPEGNNNQAGVIEFKNNIQPNTEYKIATRALQFDRSLINPLLLTLSLSGKPDNDPVIVKTEPAGNTKTLISSAAQSSSNESPTATMPACALVVGEGTVVGCIAQAVYYVFFVPTSYLFALAGTFFDYTFAYSINDTSYRSAFVVQGWGLVRDFCNMFFIFIMLYIAISTILSVHGFKTKETIINVVIIGLFINFSLFATQLIIDASNITARVFYNSDAIKITVKGQSDNTAKNIVNGTASAKEDPNTGVISLSEALVNKVNPQNIIINSKKINDISSKQTADSSVVKTANAKDNETNMTAGTFILIVFLAVAINVVGIIVFLSVGLIFVTRVIGLWLAMIMAPLAFFTYITPGMAKTKMIGWENWWPETIKLAFLAPVFIFFMYIILKFLELDLISDPLNSTNGLGFLVATIIPFAFIMILMLKAKNLATDMSGEMGQKITGAVAAAGGMALGGAAMGTAFLGRQTIGGLLKGSATGDTAAQRYARGESKGNWDNFKGRIGSSLGGVQIQRSIGNFLNQRTNRLQENAHGRHRLDETAGQVYHGRKWDSLNATERDAVRDRINQTEAMRQMGTWGNRTWAQLNDPERGTVNAHIATNGVNEAQHIVQHAQRTTRVQDSLLQSASFGTYDVRNIGSMISNEYDNKLSKFGVGIMSTVAQGLRGSLKQSNINYGQGQGGFFKDLSHTLTEALKSTTIKVDLSNVGKETKGEPDHGAAHH